MSGGWRKPRPSSAASRRRITPARTTSSTRFAAQRSDPGASPTGRLRTRACREVRTVSRRSAWSGPPAPAFGLRGISSCDGRERQRLASATTRPRLPGSGEEKVLRRFGPGPAHQLLGLGEPLEVADLGAQPDSSEHIDPAQTQGYRQPRAEVEDRGRGRVRLDRDRGRRPAPRDGLARRMCPRIDTCGRVRRYMSRGAGLRSTSLGGESETSRGSRAGSLRRIHVLSARSSLQRFDPGVAVRRLAEPNSATHSRGPLRRKAAPLILPRGESS